MIVTANGKAGINLEHTPIDGHTAIRLPGDIAGLLSTHQGEGRSLASARPQRLKWHLSPAVIKGVEKAEVSALPHHETSGYNPDALAILGCCGRASVAHGNQVTGFQSLRQEIYHKQEAQP